MLHTAEEALVIDELPARVMPVLAEYHFPPLKKVSLESLEQHTVYQGNILADASFDEQIQKKIPEVFIAGTISGWISRSFTATNRSAPQHS